MTIVPTSPPAAPASKPFHALRSFLRHNRRTGLGKYSSAIVAISPPLLLGLVFDLSGALFGLLRAFLDALRASIRHFLTSVLRGAARLFRGVLGVAPGSFRIVFGFRSTRILLVGSVLVLWRRCSDLICAQRKQSYEGNDERETFHLLPPFFVPNPNSRLSCSLSIPQKD